MWFWDTFQELAQYSMALMTWRSCCEIVFFTSVIYYFSKWLYGDNKKNLVALFYSYIILGCFSYFLQLYTITLFLFFFAPAFIMIFILLHQEILQRNYITLQNKAPLLTVQDNWIDLLMRICLHTINKNKDVTIILEQEDTLDDILHVPFKIDTPLNFTLLTVLIESSTYNQTNFIWISKDGNLLGINASLKATVHNQWFEKSVQDLDEWKKQAIALTQKNDALVFNITHLLRTFTIIFEGKLFDQLHGNAALRLIKQYVITNSNKKGFMYGYAKKNCSKQLQS